MKIKPCSPHWWVQQDQYSRIQHAELAERVVFLKEEQAAEAKVIVLGNNIHDTLLGNQEVPVESETGTINKVETKSLVEKGDR